MSIDLTCSCGARLLLVVDKYGAGYIAREREAFHEAHTACRTRPTLLWGGDQA